VFASARFADPLVRRLLGLVVEEVRQADELAFAWGEENMEGAEGPSLEFAPEMRLGMADVGVLICSRVLARRVSRDASSSSKSCESKMLSSRPRCRTLDGRLWEKLAW
jgi:hypothetical protein